MKTCATCGHQNADDMRFCLECGKPLPDAPIVFDLQGGSSYPGGGPPTNPIGGPTSFGGFQPQQSQPPQGQFSMIPPAKPRSNKKIYIAFAGIFAVVVLVFVGIAGIVAYNLMKEEESTVKNSPTPTATPKSNDVSTPKTSDSSTPKSDDVSTPRTDKSSTDPRASIGKIWADFDVKEGGRLGMRVHTQFTVYNLRGDDLYLALYFQKEDGTPLKTSNRKFASTAGEVAVFESLKPGFDEALYEDVDLFMPYDELKLSKGNYDLRIDASVIYKGGGLVDHLDYFQFQYEKY
ncbi:MAG TPA: zinc ribbon domain-containing protein [Pyrinomonadaceae bacterium]|nr:zinc ribbon domain-containing protein [Pyrinomonadaceae bacterium]